MVASRQEENYIEPNTKYNKLTPYIIKIWKAFYEIRFILIIGTLAFLVKIAYIHSIDMWDEGWFSAIAIRMAEGLSDPFLPLYYSGNNATLEFFDKPPFSFWLGAILMSIFGRTTFAAKGIVILGGTGLALIIYFLYSHQTKNKSAAVIAGLLVALANFLTFYSRTAYIDPFVIFMGALVMLFGIRAIDAVLIENNLKKGYLLLLLTAAINVFNLLTKAWQGILTAPAIVIYLVFRYIERHIEITDLKVIWNEIRSSFTFSTNKLPHQLVLYSKYSLPLIIPFISAIISFLTAFLLNKLILSGLLIAIITYFGFSMVFIRYGTFKSTEKTILISSIVASIISGFLAGFSGGLVIKVFYNRLETPFRDIGMAFGSEEGFLWGPFEGILNFFADAGGPTTEKVLLLILELISGIFGGILSFVFVFFVAGFLLDLFAKIPVEKKLFWKYLINATDILPLGILGGVFGFWAVFLLFLGEFFNRDAANITIFGIFITILATIIISFYPKLKNNIIKLLNKKFKLNGSIRDSKDLKIFRNHLIFLGIAIIFIILSFYPFVAWVQFLDLKIADGTFPWKIRVPGELYSDPQRPDPVTYTFLFFEYYISWRFSHGTKYNLPDSIAGVINDYTLIVIGPFFLVGLFAFFISNKRNVALGSAFIAWLITIPFVFFPAQFQLNYYYIPLTIPYFAIAAKGIEFIYSQKQLRITVNDNLERALAGGYFFLEIGLLYIIAPFLNFYGAFINFITGSNDLSIFLINLDIFIKFLFVASIYLIPFSFITFKIMKTFPGILSAGFAYKFFLNSWIHDAGFDKLYSILFHDLLKTIITLDLSWIQEIFKFGAPIVTLIGIVILIFGLYWLKPKVKPQALIILGLTLSAMLINLSSLIYWNHVYDLRYQEISIYINNHGGNYNYSTWVIPEAGTSFGMRYYLGYEVRTSGNYPLNTNSTIGMDNYYRQNKNIKFWVIINNSKHWDVPAYAVNYSNAYKWFTTNKHLVCVDEVVGLNPWHYLHLFVNKTWIIEQDYDWTKLRG